VHYRLQLRQNHGAEDVRSFLESWVEQPALRRLVEAEEGEWPTGPLEQRVEALHSFSERWDFRSGAERLEIGQTTRDDREEEVLACAADLGMTKADRPLDDQYEHAIVLGGTALASIYRLRRLYDLRASGIDVRHTAVLTALREVPDAELALVRERTDIAAVASGSPRTEFDVMTRAVELFNGCSADVEHIPNPNPNLSAARAQIGDVLVLAAPAADPARRPTTRDNYAAYTDEVGPTDSVLVVTSSIYLPYQHFVALQALGWEHPRLIESVGFPPEWMRGVLTGPQNVLQELRSAFFGANALLQALSDE
jgi:hypothetical protein